MNLRAANLHSSLLSVNISCFGLRSQVFPQNKTNTGRREHKKTEKEMRRDGQKDQVTAMIQVQMEKDETTPELNKNK